MDLARMGERIKTARTNNKLTLEKFSEKVGISRNFLWEIEAGRKAPAVNTLYNIGKELDISIDYLFGLTPKRGDEPEKTQDISRMVESLEFEEIKILYELLKVYCKMRK